jgi:hypothetical protein
MATEQPPATAAMERLRARLTLHRMEAAVGTEPTAGGYTLYDGPARPATRRGPGVLSVDADDAEDRRWSLACWLAFFLALTNSATLVAWMLRLPVPFVEPFLIAHGIAQPCR